MEELTQTTPTSTAEEKRFVRLHSVRVSTENDQQTQDMPIQMQTNHLSVFYGSFEAVNDISIDFRKNKVTALIGPSGCGKSTVLRSLNRMNDIIPGTSIKGEIMLEGKNIYSSAFDVVELRRRVGMVFQRPNPFPKSIYDNVAFGPRLTTSMNRTETNELVERCLRQAALWDEVKDRLKDSALALSGGQQQRLCIARALATNPEVILMDEPASALDPIATNHIEELIRQLVKDVTIIIVTHNMQQAARISDFTAFLITDETRIGRLGEFDVTTKIFMNPTHKATEDYISGRYG
jgi:phosphate transport system ATP-binding protein